MVQNYIVLIILILTLVFWTTNGFNLSPRPNQIFREPKLKKPMAQSESSYFGFTINLRESSVIVGAPRAQSTIRSQRRINETGAIYKCTIATNDSCAPFIFDNTGNKNDQNEESIFDSQKKDNQWLGASMDGGPKDTDKLVVCAPRLLAYNSDIDYLIHGICYWTPDTLSDNPQKVTVIAPLRLRSMRITSKIRPYYMYGEQGVSVHVTSNNDEIIIGAPGIYDSKGSVIRYLSKFDDNSIGMSQGQTRENKNVSVVPNPGTWNQGDDSYFGYSVGSGYFDSDLPNKIYYVASAPQANHQSGEVYIFDIIKTPSGDYHSIKKFFVFHGLQFGEYFGYAVLAEDLNGDGLADLIITAPQYSSDDIVEQGAMYVFINKGRFIFELQKLIKSPVEGIGRFGSSISKLGDINRDGYNDIAVGAPFAGNGTVFIYLGSSKGLREVSSQQLSAGPIASPWGSSPMFGHGLSKGADIDNNGFNDLAIGAPNAESVFVYRAYPVVQIHATINSTRRQIKAEEKSFQIEICYRMSTESQKVQSQDITLRLNLDPKLKRVTLQQTNLTEMTFNVSAVTKNQCRLLDANITFYTADIFKPIELEMHYDLIDGVPDSEEFCDKCAAVDPADPKVIIDKMMFTTECEGDICVADLKVTSSGLGPKYIVGSNMTISVTYEVMNSGETAYLPQINITSSNKMPFNKIPPSCNQHGHVLSCDLNRGHPMLKNSQDHIRIVYDTSHFEGSSISLTAVVFSMGKEENPSDNIVSDIIDWQEFTEIEAIGKTNTANIYLGTIFNSTEIIDNYKIKSHGPSIINELEIAFEIPIAHKFNGSIQPVPLIDVNNITIQASYNKQQLLVELQGKILLFGNRPSISSKQTKVTQDGKQIIYQPPKINSVELGNSSEKLYPAGAHRRRRSTEQVARTNEYMKTAENKLHELLSKEQMESLPSNRTIVFSCIDPEMVTCVRAVMKVNNFIPDTPVHIALKYHIDLNEVNKILKEPLEFLVIVPKLDIVNLGDLKGNSTSITRKMEYIVIQLKHQLYNTDAPWWIIFLGILGGLLFLAAIAYGMHKGGFFRRNTKEEMNRLIQEQQDAAHRREEMNEIVHETEDNEG